MENYSGSVIITQEKSVLQKTAHSHIQKEETQKLQPYSNVKVCIEKTRQDDAAMKNVISVKRLKDSFRASAHKFKRSR